MNLLLVFLQHSMIYFFHHYELPVILQQAQIQDILMRNQEGGGPPLRFTQRTNNNMVQDNNNIANNNNNNNNGVLRREMARAGGFSIAGFRFRFGVVLTTHQPRQPPQQPAQDQQQQHTAGQFKNKTNSCIPAGNSNICIFSLQMNLNPSPQQNSLHPRQMERLRKP